MKGMSPLLWHPRLTDPIGERQSKSHSTGYTMVIDKGMGIRTFEDLVQTAATYIDLLKIGFGSAALYPTDVLTQKIALARRNGICILPGGTFLEIAYSQQRVTSFLDTVQAFGFEGIEISDGTIDLPEDDRNRLIDLALERQLRVFTEYGKKHEGSEIEIEQLKRVIASDLKQGAELVTVEARESGRSVGLFDAEGQVKEDLDRLLDRIGPTDRIMWETPLKAQQVEFIQRLGPNVNLGNIQPEDVLALECLRRGLRSDTFVKS